MRIWEYTVAELTGSKEPTGGPDAQTVPQPFVPETVVPIVNNPRFATAMVRGSRSFANQALLDLREGNWVCVGSYVDDTIHIDPGVRGKGLAEELVLRCAEHRNSLPVTTNLTYAGY